MNQEAFDKTIEDGGMFLFAVETTSMDKGETSGHTQLVKDIHVDCDNDTF